MRKPNKLWTAIFTIALFMFGWTVSHRIAPGNAEANSTAGLVISSFYKEYLNNISKSESDRNPNLHLPFSKSFQALIDLDRKTCNEKAGTDICGWGADGDIYLNAQEYDPKLNFENAEFRMAEPSLGTVNVTLNVYPSIKTAGEYYKRIFQFLLIQENGQWVVDEMISQGKSERKNMVDEINSWKK